MGEGEGDLRSSNYPLTKVPYRSNTAKKVINYISFLTSLSSVLTLFIKNCRDFRTKLFPPGGDKVVGDPPPLRVAFFCRTIKE